MGNICGSNDYVPLDSKQYDINIELVIHKIGDDKLMALDEFRWKYHSLSINNYGTITLALNKKDVNTRLYYSNKRKLLHIICSKFPNYDAIKTLIDNGANINARCPNGNTPLMLLCCQSKRSKQYNNILRLLAESGTNLFQTNDNQMDCVDLLKRYNAGNIEAIQYLMNKQKELLESVIKNEK